MSYTISIIISLCLCACSTTRQAEDTFSSNTDSTRVITREIVNRRDSVFVHDSVFVEYRFGRVDTLFNYRVDTLYKYKEKVLYNGLNEEKTRVDTLYRNVADTLYITKTETIEKKPTFWDYTKFGFGLVIIFSLVVGAIYTYYRLRKR